MRKVGILFLLLGCSSLAYADTKAITSGGSVAPAINTQTNAVTTPPVNPSARPLISVGDADITSNLQQKFAEDPKLNGASISVMTNGGVVTLDGSVNSKEQADEAVNISRKTDGVKDIQSKLVVNNASANPNTPTPTR